MSAFLTVIFWVYAFCTIVGLVNLMGEHPRIIKPASVGFDCASFIIHLVILGWGGYLLWGTK
jgi:hypothetical protein